MAAPYALSSDLVSAWPAKSLEVAQYIDGQLPLIAMTQNAQTGTTYTPGLHRLVLSLSDPRFSYQVVKWNEIDPALLWSGVDLSVQWYNVVIPADLVA